MTLRESIKEQLNKNRPNLAESSVKTYVSLLFNLAKKLDIDNIKYFNEHVDKILDHFKEIASNLRKTSLSALYILTNNDKYKEIMLEDCKKTNDYYKEQTKNDKEKENWLSFDEIKAKYDELYSKVKAMFSRNAVVDDKVIIDYLVIACLSGASGLSPRRSMDYSEMKIKNYDPKTDNYYKNGVFYYNQYKTSKKYGLTTIDIKKEAPQLNDIIKKWIKINPTDYLLYSSNKNKLNSSQITKISNSIFGKNVSCDLMRHIFLTNYYKDKPMPTYEELDKL
eukprot:gene17870-24971_t